MKKHAGILLGFLLLAAPLCAEELLTLKTPVEKDSYRTGVEIVRSLQKRGGSVNLDLVIQGMKDALTGEIVPITDEATNTTFAADQPKTGGQDKKAQQQAAAPEVRPETKTAPVGNPQRIIQPDTQEPRVAMGNKSSIQASGTSPSVAQRGQDRNANKLRGLELRKQSILQGK